MTQVVDIIPYVRQRPTHLTIWFIKVFHRYISIHIYSRKSGSDWIFTRSYSAMYTSKFLLPTKNHINIFHKNCLSIILASVTICPLKSLLYRVVQNMCWCTVYLRNLFCISASKVWHLSSLYSCLMLIRASPLRIILLNTVVLHRI